MLSILAGLPGLNRVAISLLRSGFLVSKEPVRRWPAGCGSSRGGQSGVQGAGLGGPSVVGVLASVEEGVGANGVQFVPGELVAGGEPQRGVGGVAALVDQVLVRGCGGLGGADAGAGGQGGAVGGHQPAGGGDGDHLGRVAFGGLQVPTDPGVFGEVCQGLNKLGQEVAVPEASGRRPAAPGRFR